MSNIYLFIASSVQAMEFHDAIQLYPQDKFMFNGSHNASTNNVKVLLEKLIQGYCRFRNERHEGFKRQKEHCKAVATHPQNKPKLAKSNYTDHR